MFNDFFGKGVHNGNGSVGVQVCSQNIWKYYCYKS